MCAINHVYDHHDTLCNILPRVASRSAVKMREECIDWLPASDWWPCMTLRMVAGERATELEAAQLDRSCYKSVYDRLRQGHARQSEELSGSCKRVS